MQNSYYVERMISVKRWQKYRRILNMNRNLVKKYPFLLPRNRFSGEPPDDYDYSYTEWDLMEVEQGWYKMISLLIKDLRKELIRCNYLNDYRIMQVKEKYGGLRWYSGGIPIDCDADKIADDYEYLSNYVCCKCGSLEAHNVNVFGWYTTICRDCFNKQMENRALKGYKTINYDDLIDPEDILKDKREWTTHDLEHGEQHHSCDISGIISRLRKVTK